MSFKKRLNRLVLTGLVSASIGFFVSSSYDRYLLDKERKLFKLDDLETDFSVKRLNVDVLVGDIKGVDYNLETVISKVKSFYSEMDINLELNVVNTKSVDLVPAKKVRVELLTFDEWVSKMKDLGYAKDLNLNTTYGMALIKDSVCFINVERLNNYDKSLTNEDISKTISHELGHLCGLWHSYLFNNDPVPNTIFDERFVSYNFMYAKTFPWNKEFFNGFQKKVVHSYLGKGKVYNQLKHTNFDDISFIVKSSVFNGFKIGENK